MNTRIEDLEFKIQHLQSRIACLRTAHCEFSSDDLDVMSKIDIKIVELVKIYSIYCKELSEIKSKAVSNITFKNKIEIKKLLESSHEGSVNDGEIKFLSLKVNGELVLDKKSALEEMNKSENKQFSFTYAGKDMIIHRVKNYQNKK